MADISNQLEGATEGLDRFIDSLDEISIRLGSNAALEAKLARAKKKEQRLDAKLIKQKVLQVRNLTDLNKVFKEVSKNMKDFAKQSLGKVGQGMKMAAKAGAVGALIAGVKVLVDGLLKVDTQMGKLVGRLGMTREELAPMKKSIIDAHGALGRFGITFEQVATDAANITEAFGKVPVNLEKMVNVSLRLQKVYGVTAEHAASLVTNLERANKDSREFVDNIGKKAQEAGVLTTLVMRGLAANAEQFAIQTQRGQESMVNFAIDMAAVGGSVDSIKGLESAFVDFEKVQSNMSKATSIFGTDIQRNMGDVQALYKSAIEGNFDYITKRQEKTLDALFRFNKEDKRLVTARSGFTLEANYIERKALEELYGMEFSKLKELTIHRKRMADTSDVEYHKQHKRTKELETQQERENQLMNEKKNAFQRIVQIFSGVYDRLMVQLSNALGIDQGGEGSIHEAIGKLEEKVEEIFNFKKMRQVSEAHGGGIKGFISAIIVAFEASGITDVLGDLFIAAADKLIAYMREDSFLVWAFTEKTKTEKDAEKMEQFEQAGRRREHYKGFADQGLTHTGEDPSTISGMAQQFFSPARGMEDEAFEEQVRLAKELELDLDEYPALQKAIKARKRLGNAPQISELMSVDDGREGRNQMMQFGARGLSGYRGAAIVGEAGGEVVASRSALRTGIGISGRAANALAGIGVPGYYSGAAISESFSRQGLAGDVGSVTFQEAQVTAFIAEQRVQQAEMMNYWRAEFTRQMDEAAVGAKEERKKDGIAWGKYAKEFFKKYPATVDYALQKAFNIQGGVSAEIYKGVFSGMQKWSEGSSIKDALNHGFHTAVATSMEGGKLGEFLDGLKESNQHLHTVVAGALGAYAAGGSFKQAGGALLQTGGNMLVDKYLGGNDMRQAHALLGGSSLGNISNQVERNARNAGYGSGSVPGAAMGKYVNTPQLMMVGEGGSSEVVIPTDRIRKGLPINAGVARELGSIGVPGFQEGYSAKDSYYAMKERNRAWDARSMSGVGENLAGSSNISGYLQGQGSFADAGGFKALGKVGLGGGVLTGLSTWQQTGDWKQGVTAGVGAAAGLGISAGLMAVGVPPPLNTMIGGFAGQLIGKGLNSVFGITGGQKDARKNVGSQLTKYVQATRTFGIGKPGGLKKQMDIAIGGKENAPTEPNYNKLKEKIGGISVLNPVFGAGVSPDVLIALGTKQMLGSQASSAYSAINTSLYGHAQGTAMSRRMRTLGEGGIVTRPTQALIGERGPEAVIPLDQQQARDRDMINEMKKQNKLMMEMIKTQKESGGTEIRLDGRVIAQNVSDHQYGLANGVN